MPQPKMRLVMEEITDPDELARGKPQRERFDRNMEWLRAHAAEVYRHRGKHICIAGQELFVGDAADEVLARARAAHPEDDGLYVRYIPRENVPRIYANPRRVVPL